MHRPQLIITSFSVVRLLNLSFLITRLDQQLTTPLLPCHHLRSHKHTIDLPKCLNRKILFIYLTLSTRRCRRPLPPAKNRVLLAVATIPFHLWVLMPAGRFSLLMHLYLLPLPIVPFSLWIKPDGDLQARSSVLSRPIRIDKFLLMMTFFSELLLLLSPFRSILDPWWTTLSVPLRLPRKQSQRLQLMMTSSRLLQQL